ncbi:MAG: glycosyltransferase family 9 protein, partial [Bacteroidetes bacterium]|nr:glycosyltransferase family 9 protein [Bacteroidota bacterium]
MPKFLVIQTAFIGDVVLATAIIEKLHQYFPEARIDFLVRKGNEALLAGHPWLNEILIWDKKEGKLKNLWKMGRLIRKRRYDKVINVQRFAATGLLTAFSNAKETIGFDKNPLSRFFTKKIPHIVGGPTPLHEIDRNQLLIKDLTDDKPAKPRLYPTGQDEAKVQPYKRNTPYITISPASVWFTKQYP